MLDFIFEHKLYEILFAIYRCCNYIRLFVFSLILAVNFDIFKFKYFTFEDAIIRRRKYFLLGLYNLFSQFIQYNHIAYLQVCPSHVTMMRKTMFSHFTMAGQ